MIYTQLLNKRGGIESDLTVTRIDDDAFYLVTGTGFITHDFHWIDRHLPKEMNANLTDETDNWAVLSLMGPNARALLNRLTESPIDNASLPFAHSREIEIVGVHVRIIRITYVGELGFELHIPVAHAMSVYNELHRAGADLGLRNAGYRAIESLRLEKGYRAWGSDLTPDHTPLEAGLGWAVKLNSDIEFLGKESLQNQASSGLKKQLACFTVEDPSITLIGRETLYRNGQRVGWLSSAGFGHTVGCPIGLGYVRDPKGVDRTFLESGTYELEVAGTQVPCRIHFEPLYDPKNQRVKT